MGNNKMVFDIQEILEKNPEEFTHLSNTLKWLLKIKPNADLLLQIAALSHDIERAINPWKSNDLNFSEEEKKKFRQEHSKRSAEIVKDILIKNKFKENEVLRVYNLILNHEIGGGEADILREADVLANFEWYGENMDKIGAENTIRNIQKIYSRMLPENRKYIKEIKFRHEEIQKIINNLTI